MKQSRFKFSINRKDFGRPSVHYRNHSILLDEDAIEVTEGRGEGVVVMMPSKTFNKGRDVWYEDTMHVSERHREFLIAMYDYAQSRGIIPGIPEKIQSLVA